MSRLRAAIVQLLDAELAHAVEQRTSEIVDFLRSDEVKHATLSTWTGPEAARLIEERFGAASRKDPPGRPDENQERT